MTILQIYLTFVAGAVFGFLVYSIIGVNRKPTTDEKAEFDQKPGEVLKDSAKRQKSKPDEQWFFIEESKFDETAGALQKELRQHDCESCINENWPYEKCCRKESDL